MTWNTILPLLRWISLFWDSQTVIYSLECVQRALPHIIAKSCHSLQFIEISRRSINKLSALHNQSLIYITSTLCYNERIPELAELSKLCILSGEWILTNTSGHCVQEINRYVCDWLHCSTLQICFCNIRWGPLIPRGPKWLLTSLIG